MIKKLYDKSPVVWGVIYGEGLFVLFVMFEYFLVSTGISECGVIVDSCIRVVFGIIALLLMQVIYREQFVKLFTIKTSKRIWLYCIPFFLYLTMEFLKFPIADQLTTAYVSYFLFVCVNQLATGFWEETASKGLVMSGMLSKWKDTIKGRIGTVFITGVLFGTLHILNVLFSNDIVSCLWQALYASAFGIFLAAIYLQSNSITLCMTLHAVWDIVIRIPDYFCQNVKAGSVLNFIYTAQDVLELGMFPIMAIIICVTYKSSKSEKNEKAFLVE
jgi:membrane protease YdiL (CAAX protease family)